MTAKPSSRTKTKYLSIRADRETVRRLDKLAAWLVQRSPGLPAKRSYATRASLLEGLTVLEAQMVAEQAAKPGKAPQKPSKT